jgi:hypothetical protein
LATAPRVSIAEGIKRWLTMRCFTTTSASRKGLLDVAAFLVIPESDIVVVLRMDAGASAFIASSGSPTPAVLVIDFDQIRCIARDVLIGRDNHCDSVADVVNAS